MSSQTPNKNGGAIPKRKVERKVAELHTHPSSIKMEAKSQKLHTLLNQIWDLADTNVIIVEGNNEDYSQNIEFAKHLDDFSVCLQGLGTRCAEKAKDIRQKVQRYSKRRQPKRKCSTTSKQETTNGNGTQLTTTDDVNGDKAKATDNDTEPGSSKADTKFSNVKQNNNDPKKHRFICEVCSKTFRSKSDLRNHEGQHIGEFYKCLTCSKVFRSSRSFDNHQKSHQTTFTCPHEGCGQTFTLKSSLTNHVQKHSGELLKCNHQHCTATFTYRQGFIEHITWRHKEKPECECPVCNKKFWTPNLMRGHKLLSTRSS